MQTVYQMRKNRRGEDTHVGGRTKAGLLTPVAATKFKGSEAGIVSETVHFKLDQIMGEMMSPIRGEVISVFVPVQAMHALLNPTADYPGSNDVIRDELAQGNVLFPLEQEGEITKRCGINPIKISNVLSVCSSVRLAYNAANNMLRRRRYVNAALVTAANTAVLPAILSQTVLDKLNTVLDPEDRVNGAVSLSAQLPVQGIGFTSGNATNIGPTDIRQSDQTTAAAVDGVGVDTTNVKLRLQGASPNFYPDVYADLGTQISLTDFYQAQRMDELVRRMRKFVDENPEQGEEIVMRWARGLNLDAGREPWVVYEREVLLAGGVVRAMDGANVDQLSTFPQNQVSFTVPIPATEFGGVLITMIAIKPDEVLASQPHPMFTEPWAAENFVADEMVVDPVPVYMRDVYSDVDTADENTIAMYGGNHGLKRFYQNYGWNRHLDTNDVAAQTNVWQLSVPMSVTPENVVYEQPLAQTPFAVTTAEVCIYSVEHAAGIQTPTIFGPTPIEELAVIEDEDIFEDA